MYATTTCARPHTPDAFHQKLPARVKRPFPSKDILAETPSLQVLPGPVWVAQAGYCSELFIQLVLATEFVTLLLWMMRTTL